MIKTTVMFNKVIFISSHYMCVRAHAYRLFLSPAVYIVADKTVYRGLYSRCSFITLIFNCNYDFSSKNNSRMQTKTVPLNNYSAVALLYSSQCISYCQSHTSSVGIELGTTRSAVPHN